MHFCNIVTTIIYYFIFVLTECPKVYVFFSYQAQIMFRNQYRIHLERKHVLSDNHHLISCLLRLRQILFLQDNSSSSENSRKSSEVPERVWINIESSSIIFRAIKYMLSSFHLCTSVKLCST